MATGHYARSTIRTGVLNAQRAGRNKDQTYFLTS
ncbi:hypothetical protein PO124_20790 [Bacillus licheniformis]|nr:hypothetical protein [Bacillus licheniformis]